MHLFLTISFDQGLILPVNYNHLVQAFIYQSIDNKLAQFLHEQGYAYEKRTFRMFAVSRLMGKSTFHKETGHIHFHHHARLVISSPLEQFCDSLATNLLTRSEARLGKSMIHIDSIEAKQFKASDHQLPVRTLSPVVAYSTLTRADGRKYTCYFQPGESEFEQVVYNNLLKKHFVLHGVSAINDHFDLQPVRQPKMHIVKYKDTVIKGYAADMNLCGDPSLLQTALDCGLGSKNAQGFGCIVPRMEKTHDPL